MNKDDIAMKPDQPKQAQPFHVFLSDGRTIAIEAARFEHEVNTEETIVFMDSEGAPIKEIFVRAQAVDMIVADSAVAKTHSFIELQTRVQGLAERIDALEAQANSPTGE